MAKRYQFREVVARRKGTPSAVPRRSARLPQFVGCASHAEALLATLKVACVGVGSAGGRIAAHCARLGVGGLWLVDAKVYKPESLLTHEIGPRELGSPKALCMARRCKAISPHTRVYAFDGRVEKLPLDAFADMDLLAMATDNLPAEIEIGQRCRHLGKPLVQASVQGETLTAQVRFFSNAGVDSPCPACGFGEVEWAQLARKTQFSCEAIGSPALEPAPLRAGGRYGPEAGDSPTVSVSSLCSLAADLALNQILRFALRLGDPVGDTVIDSCGYTNRIVTSRLVRRADCPCDHQPMSLATLTGPVSESSPRQLIAAAGFGQHEPRPSAASRAGRITLTVEGHGWVESGACQCAAPVHVRRFVAAGREHVGRCPNCHVAMRVAPFFLHRAVAASLLGRAIDVPLRRLGVAGARCVLVSDGDKTVLLRNSATQPDCL